jgi:hypothetical protein
MFCPGGDSGAAAINQLSGVWGFRVAAARAAHAVSRPRLQRARVVATQFSSRELMAPGPCPSQSMGQSSVTLWHSGVSFAL